ncbi:hypothetical protein RHSIM_Rhsim05G0045100 [Rhododendron simsii]|uniref:Uncharacterized protein n=1 Tax=Rhododendron simsii TaxID=118357 RepID=A0A834GX91_RHOSS|nr:hypothetical protein RHSIM_Rhsim05G0045100 [Rhododendron simsii]
MHNFDLRLLVPALLNFILYLLNQQLPSVPNFNLDSKIGFFSVVILMLFLITSVTLRLTVTAERIRVRIADRFSFFLAIALLGSVFLSEPVFWIGYVEDVAGDIEMGGNSILLEPEPIITVATAQP